MKKEEIAELFTALREGIISELSRDGSTIRFKVVLPQVASAENPDFSFFFAVLLSCHEFYLQPFRNESTVIDDLKQVERLAPEIHEASVDGSRVKVFCAHKGVSTGARISIRCDRLEVYNESFDAMSAAFLAELRLRKQKDS